MKKFALAGNPNSGKTTLFNLLTGSTAYVGNWPGVTVDKREGKYKKLKEIINIVDLPGIYSLSPYTPEEVISRNYLIDDKPDCVINIVDATNLERNLYLTTQLMEMDIPLIVALNMMDEVKKSGDLLDAKSLEIKLGVPVVAISALKGEGIEELMKRAYQISFEKRRGESVLKDCPLSSLIEEVKEKMEEKGISDPLFHAIKIIEKDEVEAAQHKDEYRIAAEYQLKRGESNSEDFEAIIADSRYKYITSHFSSVYKKKGNKNLLTKSDKADKVLTHRVFSIPIFLLILFAVFHITFSENFLFLSGLLPEGFLALEGTAFEEVFGNGSINSPGVIITNLLNVLLNFISEGAGSLLSGSAVWVQGLIVDGVLGGLFAVLGFLPQILMLFMFFSILEDSGYMARVAFILDRIFRKFGLSGRAFMPMIMGFGCSLPAMINTRTLADERERTATIRVIPFFSCGAKLPILTAIAGGIVGYFGVGNADIITYSMYLIGIVTAIITVLIMRNTTMRGQTPPFIMELPSYRLPKAGSLAVHLWDKTKHFVKKAFTIIFASTILIWLLSHIDFSWKFYEGDEDIDKSILASIGKLLQPLFTPLGFGSQLSAATGWVFAVAAITGLVAKENVIATFGALAAAVASGVIVPGGVEEEVGYAYSMIAATNITIPALLAFIVFNMTTVPCFAAVATAKAELPKGKLKWTLLFWLVTSYVAAGVIYLVGSFWWTVFIFLAAAALAIAIICMRNKKLKAKESYAK